MMRRLRWALALGVCSALACSDDSGADESEDPVGGGDDEEIVPVDEGDPIDAPDKVWTYVELPGSTCRDGSVTGIGVSINPDSDKLVIFMEGGGACFNDLTCRVNPTSWGADNLGDGPSSALLARSAPNPMADWNMVYVPYCSGDVFTGTNPSGYGGGPMTGYTNFTKALERLVPTFKGKVDEVVLTGISAGGFGAAWNWMRTQDAFADVPVHTLDDSGQPLGTEYLSTCLQKHMTQLWGWKDSVHPACKDCDVEGGNIVRPLIEKALSRNKPGARFALLTHNEDSVIKGFFAFGREDCEALDGNIIQQGITLSSGYPAGLFTQGIDELRAGVSKYDNVAIYEVAGGSHVVLGSEDGWGTAVSGVTVLDWTKQFLAGDKAWGNVQP
jgi:hypothetical protein